MQHQIDHSLHPHQSMTMNEKKDENIFILALSATLHCLIDCGIGEVVVGFIAALPVKYIMIKRGVRHQL